MVWREQNSNISPLFQKKEMHLNLSLQTKYHSDGLILCQVVEFVVHSCFCQTPARMLLWGIVDVINI